MTKEPLTLSQSDALLAINGTLKAFAESVKKELVDYVDSVRPQSAAYSPDEEAERAELIADLTANVDRVLASYIGDKGLTERK